MIEENELMTESKAHAAYEQGIADALNGKEAQQASVPAYMKGYRIGLRNRVNSSNGS